MRYYLSAENKIGQFINDLSKNGFYPSVGRDTRPHRIFIAPETDVLAEMCGHYDGNAKSISEKTSNERWPNQNINEKRLKFSSLP